MNVVFNGASYKTANVITVSLINASIDQCAACPEWHDLWSSKIVGMFPTKNQNLSVKTRDGKLWGGDEKGYPRIYAVGDCNYSCVDAPGKKPDEWPIPPIPKISYPGEEMCIVACSNIEKTDRLLFQNKTVDCCGEPLHVWDMHWPWGAGMFATSLGPDDACFVAGANWQKNSGLMCVWGQVCAVQKEFIEASKTDECAYGSSDIECQFSPPPCDMIPRLTILFFQMGWNHQLTWVDFSVTIQASLAAVFGTSSTIRRCIFLVEVLDGDTEPFQCCKRAKLKGLQEKTCSSIVL